jgi:SAM-dependent methyltransferase
MTFTNIFESVKQYYSAKIATHGATAQGVDWNSAESQLLRFEQLLKVCDLRQPFSIIDYGCGYGALLGYLWSQGVVMKYYGFDISESMISKARELYGENDRTKFYSVPESLSKADYTVASGIFNVKLQTSDEEWHAYMIDTLAKMADLSVKGFSFNVLTSYSNPERRRTDLYYADPLFWFDHCKRRYSRFVTLLHDYPLYEFTILVRKEIF